MSEIALCNVGGTNVTAAKFDGHSLTNHVAWFTSDFSSGRALVDQLLTQFQTGRVALAVAGPVLNQKAHLTNGTLEFSANEILKMQGVKECLVVNDVVAAATSELQSQVLPGKGVLSNFDTLVLNVGTGFGGALMSSSGGGVIGIEPGRMSASKYGAMIDVVGLNSREFFEYEKLLSGRGVVEAFLKLSEQKGLTIQVSDAAEVFHLAIGGSDLAKTVLDLFWRTLAIASAELALGFPECSRILLSGSVVRKNGESFVNSNFMDELRERSEAAGRNRNFEVKMLSQKDPELSGLSKLVSGSS